MSLWVLHFFRWLGHTPLSIALRHSTWGFAVIETIHLLSLALFGGAILLVDLRLLGVGLRRQPASRVAREVSPVLLISLLVMLVSGVLLVVTGPLKYYHSPWFRTKMAFLSAAIVFYFTFHRVVTKSDFEGRPPLRSKLAALLSLALWFGVGLAGRAIGFLG